MNIVIPMAGQGSRFKEAGYSKPKPFIDVNGKSMIERVLDNLYYPNARYFLIARPEHLELEKSLVAQIESQYNAKFITVNQLTEGTASTVLFARDYINNEDPLLIANSDQLIDLNIQDFIEDSFERKKDGSILCFRDREMNPKWSFAKLNDKGDVIEVREKTPISDIATVGIYLFSKGKYFVDAAVDMIIRNDRVNNEFYTCPVYNYAINLNKRIGVYLIEESSMHGLGTPKDLNAYLSLI
jgi:dTDP-glucose pyrophosphorylase